VESSDPAAPPRLEKAAERFVCREGGHRGGERMAAVLGSDKMGGANEATDIDTSMNLVIEPEAQEKWRHGSHSASVYSAS
jgi:hypothetical protein